MQVRRLRIAISALALAAASFALGYLFGRPPQGAVVQDLRHDPSPSGPVVARFADDAVTAGELESRLAQMSPSARSRYQTLAQKREYVEGLVRFELLAHEARARGLAQDADVRETTKKVMVQRLLQQELDSELPPPSDEEIAAFYERHKQDYVRPERLRVSHIFLAAPRQDPARVAARREEAQALVAQLRETAPMDFRTFGALAVKHSDDLRSRPLEGDLRFLSEAELAEQYGPEVAAAAATLQTPGAMSGLVQTDRGLHLLKLRSRDPALSQDLTAARPQLLSRMGYERRTRRYEALLEALRQKWDVRYDAAAIDAVKVDPTAPAKPTEGPPPGFIPAPSAGGAPREAAPPAPVRTVLPAPKEAQSVSPPPRAGAEPEGRP